MCINSFVFDLKQGKPENGILFLFDRKTAPAHKSLVLSQFLSDWKSEFGHNSTPYSQFIFNFLLS